MQFILKNKKLRSFLILFLITIGIIKGYAQNISCKDLIEYVERNYDYKSSTSQTSMFSNWILYSNYYEVKENGVVIAYFKRNEFDYYGTPYIFCGVDYNRWLYYQKLIILYDSPGKAFRESIYNYKCNCY